MSGLTPESRALGRRAPGTSALEQSHHLIVWLGLLPLLLAFAAYRTSTEHYQSVQATLATDQFLGQLNGLLSTLKDAETGQRGFLLTGDERYLSPYIEALHNIGKQMTSVTQLGPANGVNRAETDRLRFEISRKMGELQLTIDLRQRSGLDAALQEVKTGLGESYMAQARATVDRINAEQRAILEARFERQRRSQLALESLLAVGVGAGILLLVFAYRFSARYARERNAAETEMRRAAESLEEHVEERTRQLAKKTGELEKLTGDLRRSNQDLLQFAYIASHDLQEPIRTISSYVGLLARRYGDRLDESAQTYIQFAVDGASRMQTLVNDLLNYSRAGTQSLEKRRTAIDEILYKALANLHLRIYETGAVIRTGNLPIIEVDETRMTQVFQNLVANAIKFRQKDTVPEVTIRASYSSDEWVFAISDNGIGFEEKYTDRIFEVFQRLHGVGKYPGNGIGLAICRRIVEHHGGRLWAESRPGVGSTFFLSLPGRGEDGVSNESQVRTIKLTFPERTAHG